MATAPCDSGQQASPLCAREPGRADVACARATGAHVDVASAVISAKKTSRRVYVHESPAFELLLLLIRPKQRSWKRKTAMLSACSCASPQT